MKNYLLLFVAFTAGFSFGQSWQKTSAPDSIRYTGMRTWGNDTIYAWGLSPSDPFFPNTLVTSFDGGQNWTVAVGSWNRTLSTVNQIVASPGGLHAGYNYNLSQPSSANAQYTTDGVNWQVMPGSSLGNGGFYAPLGLLNNGKLLLGHSQQEKLNISPDYYTIGSIYGSLYQYSVNFTYYAINPTSGRVIFGRSQGTNHLQYTDDNGITFGNMDLSDPGLVGNAHAPIIRYTKNNTFLNAWYGGVNISTNNGDTWTACNNTEIGGSLRDMEGNKNGEILVLRTDRNLVMSSNNGQNWNVTIDGLPANLSGNILGKTTNGNFWLGMYSNLPTEGGIYKMLSSETAQIVDAENGKKNFTVFPNPTENILTVTQEHGGMNLLDLKGKIVASSGEKTMDISFLPSGIYILNVTLGDETINYKIIKK